MGKKKNRGATPLDDPPAEDVAAPPAPIYVGASAGVSALNPNVRAELEQLLRSHPSRADDWYLRTVEKNLKLGKRSLASHADELAAMREEIEDEIFAEEEAREEEEEAGEDERDLGKGGPFETGDEVGEGGGTDEHEEADGAKRNKSEQLSSAPPPSGPIGTALLSLRPYVSVGGEPSELPSALWFVWLMLWSVLALLAGAETLRAVESSHATLAVDRATAAADAERADDDAKRTTHLWCPNAGQWIEREGTYVGDTARRVNGNNGDPTISPPPNIRWQNGRWERWSKNLKTKVKKAGATRGSWVAVKPGDGWVSAPFGLEMEDTSLSDSDVRFFGCVKRGVVFECTAWACSALVSRGAARNLGAVDSGRVFFHLEGSDEGKGIDAWILDQYVERAEGGESGRKASKKSRADRKSKKMAYGR